LTHWGAEALDALDKEASVLNNVTQYNEISQEDITRFLNKLQKAIEGNNCCFDFKK
jgi:hypothetical protein